MVFIDFCCKGSTNYARTQESRTRMYEIKNSVYEMSSHTLFDTIGIRYFGQTMKLTFLYC